MLPATYSETIQQKQKETHKGERGSNIANVNHLGGQYRTIHCIVLLAFLCVCVIIFIKKS